MAMRCGHGDAAMDGMMNAGMGTSEARGGRIVGARPRRARFRLRGVHGHLFEWGTCCGCGPHPYRGRNASMIRAFMAWAVVIDIHRFQQCPCITMDMHLSLCMYI